MIQCVSPLFVATKMSEVEPSLICPTPAAYARGSIATIGHQNDTFGCFGHALQVPPIPSIPSTRCSDWIL